MISSPTKQQTYNNQQLPISCLDISVPVPQTEMQQKQQFLREEILQKNFNAEDFIEYMNHKLNIDSDISRCSINQLKKVVQSYISRVKKDQIHMSQFDQNSENHMKSSMCSMLSLPPTVIVKLSKQPYVQQQQFRQSVKCRKIQQKYNTSEWKSKNVHCMVHSPNRKFVSSFLGVSTSSYLEFKIKTFGLDWEVGRRYSDFIWLRSNLQRFYPSQMIPPIPNKKAQKRLPRQLEKRMRILTLFLNDLLSYPEFINSSYLQAFLSMEDPKFTSFKKDLDSKKNFQAITATETLSGQVDVFLSKDVVIYNKQLSKWVQQSQYMLKELTRNSKNLQQGIIQQVNTLYDMGDQLAGLHAGALKISKLEDRQDSGFSRLKDIFVRLNNMVVEWGNVSKNQIDFIQTNCNVVYKYVRESLSGIRQMLQRTREHEIKYFEGKILLDQQKEKLFNLHDVQRWQIPKSQLPYIPKSAIYQKKQAFKLMLPKQSAVQQKLKMNYCFYLSQVYDNANVFLKLKAELLRSAMEEFTIRQKVNNQQVGEMWNQMSFNFTHVFDADDNKKKLWLKTEEKIRKEDTEVDYYENSSMFSQMMSRRD